MLKKALALLGHSSRCAKINGVFSHLMMDSSVSRAFGDTNSREVKQFSLRTASKLNALFYLEMVKSCK